MLDKLVIHLKNIIFFKTIIYVLIIIALVILIPLALDELVKISYRKDESRSFLNQAVLKLDSLRDLDTQLISTNARYEYLINNQPQEECQFKQELQQDLDKLAARLELSEPFNIQINTFYEHTEQRTQAAQVTLKYRLLTLFFDVKDELSLLQICNNIRSLFPQGSMILETTIRNSTYITPAILVNLSSKQGINFFSAEVTIKLREIVYAP